jgi:hypothetical protein
VGGGALNSMGGFSLSSDGGISRGAAEKIMRSLCGARESLTTQPILSQFARSHSSMTIVSPATSLLPTAPYYTGIYSRSGASSAPFSRHLPPNDWQRVLPRPLLPTTTITPTTTTTTTFWIADLYENNA